MKGAALAWFMHPPAPSRCQSLLPSPPGFLPRDKSSSAAHTQQLWVSGEHNDHLRSHTTPHPLHTHARTNTHNAAYHNPVLFACAHPLITFITHSLTYPNFFVSLFPSTSFVILTSLSWLAREAFSNSSS